MRDLYSTDVETAARMARDEEDFGPDRPSPWEYMDDPGPEPEVLVCGKVGHGYYDSDKGCRDCAAADVPVTLEDFAPRGPVAEGTDEDMPF